MGILDFLKRKKEKKRQNNLVFAAKMLWTLILVLGAFSYTWDRFAIGVDLQEDRCLPDTKGRTDRQV